MTDEARNPSECPPGLSLASWMKHGSKSKKPTAPREEALRERILTELEKLVPQAIAQARKGKPALLRLILRATR
jgi:hypothetical protein